MPTSRSTGCSPSGSAYRSIVSSARYARTVNRRRNFAGCAVAPRPGPGNGDPLLKKASGNKASGGDTGRFKVMVDPIAGYPGYCIWQISDVTAALEFETRIRDERDRLSDLLDNAPIGFYSVDGGGHFRFANRTLARLAWHHTLGDDRERGAAIRFSCHTAAGRFAALRPVRWLGEWTTAGRGRAEVPARTRRAGLDRAEPSRLWERDAYAIGGVRFDAGARVAGGAQIGRTISALFRQRSRRHRTAGRTRALRGGEPGARRAVRHFLAEPEGTGADQPVGGRGSRSHRRQAGGGHGRPRPIRDRSRSGSTDRAKKRWCCSSAASTAMPSACRPRTPKQGLG